MATRKSNDDTPSFKQQKKTIKQSNKLAALKAKGARIEAGTEPTLYDKAATITGNVAKVAGSAAEVVNAVKKRPATGGDPFKEQKGGATKRMQKGGISKGRNISQKAAERKTAKGKGYISSIMGANPSGDKGDYVPFTRAGRKDAKTKGRVSSKEMKPSRKIMKTGGMVNPNANLKATANAGSKGAMSGVNPKATASKVAKGRPVKSTAPKKALPKAMYGMDMKPGMMKNGGAKKK